MSVGRFSASVALAASAALLISAKPAEMAFVGCPIVRDTKTVPCWLAQYKGELYYLGIQTDVSAEFVPPSLGHRVLVEGTATNEPRICGGIVMKPVKISVMNQERAEDCNTILPAEDRFELPFEPPRPPGPSKGRLAFIYPTPPPAPTPPFKPKSFDILYDFDATVGFQHPRFIGPVLKYAREINASQIQITGYRGATRLEDGSILAENAEIGRTRAKQIEELLRGAGFTKARYEVIGRTQYDVGDWKNRRVTVVVSP